MVLLVWFQNLDVESLVINRGSSFRYIKRIEIPFLYWDMGGSLGDYVSWIEILFLSRGFLFTVVPGGSKL